jgi:hypothetical protein
MKIKLGSAALAIATAVVSSQAARRSLVRQQEVRALRPPLCRALISGFVMSLPV